MIRRRYRTVSTDDSLRIKGTPDVVMVVREILVFVLSVLVLWLAFTYLPYPGAASFAIRALVVILVILIVISLVYRNLRKWQLDLDGNGQAIKLNGQLLAYFSEIRAIGCTQVEEAGKRVWQGFALVERLGRIDLMRHPQRSPVDALLDRVQVLTSAAKLRYVAADLLPETTFAAGKIDRPMEALARKFWLHADAHWLLPREIVRTEVPNPARVFLDDHQRQLQAMGFKWLRDYVDRNSFLDPMMRPPITRLMQSEDQTTFASVIYLPFGGFIRAVMWVTRQKNACSITLWSQLDDAIICSSNGAAQQAGDSILSQAWPGLSVEELLDSHQDRCRESGYVFEGAEDYVAMLQQVADAAKEQHQWDDDCPDENLKRLLKGTASQRQQLKRELILFAEARRSTKAFVMEESADPELSATASQPAWTRWTLLFYSLALLAVLVVWFQKPWRKELILGSGDKIAYAEYLLGGAHEGESVPIIMALHGLGDYPESFAALFDGWDVKARLIVPAGPRSYIMGTGWYGIENDYEILEGIQASADLMREFMQDYQKQNPGNDSWTLVGFSQGAYVATGLAIYYPDSIAAVYALSGGVYLDLPEDYRLTNVAPIYAFHGMGDDVIPVEWDAWSAAYVQEIGGHYSLYVDPVSKHGPSRSTQDALKQMIVKQWALR